MNNNVKMVQKQIKAFNKAFSRAEKANIISGQYRAQIYDLIDNDRMTKSGYGKAGSKYLSSLSEEELQAYASDIEKASQFIQLKKINIKYDFNAADLKGLLWSMSTELYEKYGFDSDDTRAVEMGEVDIDIVDYIIEMDKLLSTKSYGMADFGEWFEKQQGLQ